MNMRVKYYIGLAFLFLSVSLSTAQNALPDDLSEAVNAADRKVILEQFSEAREIYQNIISTSDYSIVAAYAHYKLGQLCIRENMTEKAKGEYKKGLLSLKKAGAANHQIGKYLEKALESLD